MSRENVDLVRRAYEAITRGDLQGAVSLVSPDFEYVASGEILGLSGRYQGPAGLTRFLEGFWGMFDEPRFEIHGRTIENDDRVLVSLTMGGRGRQSGAEAQWRVFQVWTLRAGRATYGQAFMSRAEALEAAGLSEPAP